MRPTDVLIHRRMLLEACERATADGDVEDVGAALIGVLPEADACYISPDMTAVAKHLGRSLPNLELDASVVPSPSGFLMWDSQPLANVTWDGMSYPVRGAVWANAEYSESTPGVLNLNASIDRVNALTIILLMDPSAHYSTIPHVMPGGNMFWRHGHTPGDAGGFAFEPGEVDIPALLLTTWILMGQTIARVNKTQAERHERKRSIRAGLPDFVTIVHLRRHSETGRQPDDERPTEWTHRWLVDAHWRNQWYPSTGEHKPIPIFPYVKGPRHLPLIVKDKVKALVR
jgi:hypothetical protein